MIFWRSQVMETWFLSSALKTWYISETVWFYLNTLGQSTWFISTAQAILSFPSIPKTIFASYLPKARFYVFPLNNARWSYPRFACSNFHTCCARYQTGNLIYHDKTLPLLINLLYIPWWSFSGCRTYHCHYVQSCWNCWIAWGWALDFSWGLIYTRAEFACRDEISSWESDLTSSLDASFSYILTLIIYYPRKYQQSQSLTNNQG